MNILIVDDEALILKELKRKLTLELPDDALYDFSRASEAMEFARNNRIDIAFLDIDMRVINGIRMAETLKDLHPDINIIFCTGYTEYAVDAVNLHASGYLLKPISQDDLRKALSNLIRPVSRTTTHKRVFARCFGDFEVFADGKPVSFRYEKTRELFACLVDRRGSMCSSDALSVRLWEEDDHAEYFKKLRRDLIQTLESLGCDDILSIQRGRLGILTDMIDCDYYEWLRLPERRRPAVREYMTQYSWAEEQLATITSLSFGGK